MTTRTYNNVIWREVLTIVTQVIEQREPILFSVALIEGLSGVLMLMARSFKELENKEYELDI